MRWYRISALVLVLFIIATGAIFQGTSAQMGPEALPDRIEKTDPRAGDIDAMNFTSCQSEVCAEDGPIVYMPFGCQGASANPHKSKVGKKNNKEEITAKSRTFCPAPVVQLVASNKLYRNHFLYWGQEGKAGYASKYSTNFVEAVAVTKCNNDLYLVEGRHTVVGGGQTYYSWSGKTANVNC